MKKVEILAPAGSYESMVGAFAAGADAVYMGGQKFGARAYADNPDDEKLLAAIDYAHIHGKKLYLTVNTLQKDYELEKTLYEYLDPLYRHGLDAVIVQDMGVLCAVREWFPDLDVHASTQMTVVSADHARQLKTLGVTRIVPARELNLEEIRHIKNIFQGEVECFVHGALCYCYSGQCLLSSVLGGRSGNRGRCAQPCRLPYGLFEDGRRLGTSRKPYLLSLKDMCTLELIPDLVDAGIDSFKIEGRMKKPEYAAFVSHIYRKYTDLYLQHGRQGFHVDMEDVGNLMDLYNRGGFSQGYYRQHNGANMISFSRPNHFGRYVGEIIKVSGGKGIFEPRVSVGQGDVLLAEGMDDKTGVTVKAPMIPGKTYPLAVPFAKPGMKIYRMRNEALIRGIHKDYLDKKNQEKIYISLTLSKELPAKIQIECRDFKAEVSGPVVEAAQKQPLTQEVIREKMLKTGNTPFKVEKLDIHMDDNIYIPLTALNQLRRDAIEALTEAMHRPWRRRGTKKTGELKERTENKESGSKENVTVKTALVSRFDVLDVLIESGQFSEIYFESWLVYDEKFEKQIQKVHEAGLKVYLAFPYIFREKSAQKWNGFVKRLLSLPLDGFVVRNMESLQFIKDHDLLTEGKYIISDYTVYIMNQRAAAYYKQLGISRTTVPMELNFSELLALECGTKEMVVYGHIPLMITAGCLYKNLKKCSGFSKELRLEDRYHKSFPVKTVCSECYNLIYNSQPLVLYDLESKLERLRPDVVRYNFTFESPEAVRKIIENPGKNILQDFTRGHFNRGVE